MRQFSILLPLSDNAGVGLASAHQSFQSVCMDMLGGFTDAGDVRGRWQGPDRVYTDTLKEYRVGCEPAEFQSILDAAHLLFPDQKAIFASDMGDCWLSEPHRHDIAVSAAA